MRINQGVQNPGNSQPTQTTFSRMANLSQTQAIKLIKEPANRRELTRAIAKRLRHSLHVEADDIGADEPLGPAHNLFLRWVKLLLNDDENFKRFLSLYRPPIPTNELAESIFSQFERIFEANDAFEKVEFDDPELVTDFDSYRKTIGDSFFWETQGFETFKTSIDNILVVDLPKLQVTPDGDLIQESDLPEPYYFMLDIAQVIDIDNRKVKATDTMSGKSFYYFKCEYLIFWETATTVCVFDDAFYRTFLWENGKEPVLLTEVAHGLGFTPARSFWTTPLNSKSRILKRAPITNSLSELDWLLAYNIFGKYLKLYAPFPIYAVYKSSCNYKDEARSMKCSNGWLVAPGMKQGEHSGERCPKCKNKFSVGPGRIAEFTPPQDKDQPDLLSNPIVVIPAEATSVETVDNELRYLETKIYDSCVGKGSDVTSKEAINEDQVKAGFETKENVLNGVKRNFEIAHAFVLDTIARLRYGDKYKSVTISYGTDFFVPDEEAEMTEYTSAKNSGLPEFHLDARRDQIVQNIYRNNPDQVERMKILKALDPFPDKNIEEALKLSSYADDVDLIVKANFVRFVDRFERENTGLLVFGNKASFDKKIAVISEALRGYAIELQKNIKPKALPPAPEPIPGAAA
jgi:hypothetical protein